MNVGILDAVIKAVVAYAMGGLLGSLIVGKLKGGVDIRQHGSGNAGGTNALRTQGWWFAMWVMVIDIGKGWVATRCLAEVAVFGVPVSEPLIVSVICAIAVVLGHVYPCWFGFRGGKGAATLVGIVAGIAPAALPWVLGVWLAVLVLSGFVGLSTLVATASFGIWVMWVGGAVPLRWFSVVMMLLVIYTHRANIARMRSGTENRAKTLWLFKPKTAT